MTEMHEAVSAAKNLAKQFRGVLQVAEVLEGIGNLENLRREAEEAARKAILERNEAQFQLRKAGDELKEATATVQKARENALATIEQTKASVKNIMDVADEEAAERKIEVEQAAKAAEAATELNREAHRKSVKAWGDKAAAARAEFDEIEAQLAALRERIGK